MRLLACCWAALTLCDTELVISQPIRKAVCKGFCSSHTNTRPGRLLKHGRQSPRAHHGFGQHKHDELLLTQHRTALDLAPQRCNHCEHTGS